MNSERTALEFIAQHLSSDWPERCQENVRCARAALAATPEAPADLRVALLLAREYVECAGEKYYDGTSGHGIRIEAKRRLALIDAALAQPPAQATEAQAEPVAWRYRLLPYLQQPNRHVFDSWSLSKSSDACPAPRAPTDQCDGWEVQPIYASPPTAAAPDAKDARQPLSEERLDEIEVEAFNSNTGTGRVGYSRTLSRAVERALAEHWGVVLADGIAAKDAQAEQSAQLRTAQ